ncbi:MAG TPA: DNA cytosine methyltransferase, partial [Cytophagaceae bacterium]
STIVSKAEHLLVTPFLKQYHSYDDSARGQELVRPLLTQDTSNRYGMVMPYLTEYYGNAQGGLSVEKPLHTITTKDREGITLAHLEILRNHAKGQAATEPLNTICTSAEHFGVVKTYLEKWGGCQDLKNWPLVRELLNKYCGYNIAEDEILILEFNDIKYFISDIGMRMLEPRELFRAQGFPDTYIIDHDYTGKPYPKTAQVARCGNAVPPPFAEALVKANLPELCRKENDIAI